MSTAVLRPPSAARGGRPHGQVRVPGPAGHRGSAATGDSDHEAGVMNWQCQHYRCHRTDVMPVAYWVLGSEFIRLLCPDHQPVETTSEDRASA